MSCREKIAVIVNCFRGITKVRSEFIVFIYFLDVILIISEEAWTTGLTPLIVEALPV